MVESAEAQWKLAHVIENDGVVKTRQSLFEMKCVLAGVQSWWNHNTPHRSLRCCSVVPII